MAGRIHRGLILGLLLVAFLGLAATGARAQATTDLVVTVSYVSLKPEQAGAWVSLFKKHFKPALEDLKKEGALAGWHLFVPGLHHPGYTWTHAIVLAYKDRASQAAVEKKIEEVLAAMPTSDRPALIGAIDMSKHFDDEWREVDLADQPAEKKAEEKK